MPKFTLQQATKVPDATEITFLKLHLCIKNAGVLQGVSELPGGVKEHPI